MALGRSIRRHQHRIAYIHPGVDDFVLLIGWKVLGGRGIAIGHQPADFSSENPLVEFDCCLALAVEENVRNDFHVDSLLNRKLTAKDRIVRFPQTAEKSTSPRPPALERA